MAHSPLTQGQKATFEELSAVGASDAAVGAFLSREREAAELRRLNAIDNVQPQAQAATNTAPGVGF